MAQPPDLQPPLPSGVERKQFNTARKNCLAVFVAFLVAFVWTITITVGTVPNTTTRLA